MSVIRIETHIKSDVKLVYNLSRSPELYEISAQKLNQEVYKKSGSGLVGEGEVVTWKTKMFGNERSLSVKVKTMKACRHIEEEMSKGSFESFKHLHLFRERKESILMINIIEYEVSLGVLGKLADMIFIKDYISKWINVRTKLIKEYAESDKWKSILT